MEWKIKPAICRMKAKASKPVREKKPAKPNVRLPKGYKWVLGK